MIILFDIRKHLLKNSFPPQSDPRPHNVRCGSRDRECVCVCVCLCVCVCVCVCVCAGWSLQAEALSVGDCDGEFVFELLPGAVHRETDLIKTGVRDRQPAETQRQRRGEG